MNLEDIGLLGKPQIDSAPFRKPLPVSQVTSRPFPAQNGNAERPREASPIDSAFAE